MTPVLNQPVDHHPFVYVANSPLTFIDATGLAKGGKQNINVSPGDPIGDKIRAIENNKNLTPAERNKAIKEIEKEIKKLPKGPQKDALRGLAKVAKRIAKICIILGVLTELLLDPSEAAAPTGPLTQSASEY